MIQRHLIGVILLQVASHFPGLCQTKLEFQDKIYEPQIKTVLCYQVQGDASTQTSAITTLNGQNLILEFDDLQEQKNNYYIKVIHCNFDWSRSNLMDLDFMREYNEVVINDYSYSINTHIPYVHYRVPIPQVKIPGNYLIIVYRDGDKENLILSRRIAVTDNRISLVQNDDISGLGNLRSTNQALNFTIDFSRTEVINPMGNLHITIRQNQRWDNVQQDVKPSFVREDISQMEFRFFDMDKTFQGGNEFRFVDFRSLNYPGQNTFKLDQSHKPYNLVVAQDAVRTSQAYAQYNDLNGSFYVDNRDYPQEPWISANYLFVNFTLLSPVLQNDIYVIGAFNNWAKTDENKMVFSQGNYHQRILLKQGFYNYQYWVDGPKAQANQIEGNHFQTENVYEVLVYYRAFQPNADMLLGYFVIPVNPH